MAKPELHTWAVNIEECVIHQGGVEFMALVTTSSTVAIGHWATIIELVEPDQDTAYGAKITAMENAAIAAADAAGIGEER